MRTVPINPDDAILWLSNHLDTWGEELGSVGLAELDITQLQGALDEVTAARAKAVALRSASKAATSEYKNKLQHMREATSLRVSKIRTYARGTANPEGVYTLAEIPAPATPTETPAPATPQGFKVRLLESGALEFTFKCANPRRVQGVTYRVERQDAPQSPYVFLVNAKEKSFEDDAFPSTSSLLTYRVTAQTSTKDGAATYFTVRYGAGSRALGGQAAGGARIVSQGTALEREAGQAAR